MSTPPPRRRTRSGTGSARRAGDRVLGAGPARPRRGRPEEARDRLEALAAAGPGESHPMVGIFSAADLVEAAVRTGQSRRPAGR